MGFVKLYRAKLLIWIMMAVLLGSGIYYVLSTWNTSMKETSTQAIKSAKIGQIAISGEMLVKLLDNPDNTYSVAYRSLEKRLIELTKNIKDIHAAYIYTDINRMYIFTDKKEKLSIIVSSGNNDSSDEYDNSVDYMPTWEEGLNKDKEYLWPIMYGKSLVTQPKSDQFGTWVNVLIPIKNDDGNTIAVFALAYPEKTWTGHAVSEATKSTIVVLFLLWLVVLFYELMKKQDRKILQQEIDKNFALKREMEIKDGMFFTLTHEFKTPLSIINSALQTIEYVCRNEISDKMRKYHNYIKLNSNRQLRLVNNLLDITRIQAGRLEVNNSDIDIESLTKDIVDSIRVIAEQRGIGLQFLSNLNNKAVNTDVEKYERIILNLLSNALKFTPKGKSITVIMQEQTIDSKPYVATQVCDEGIGIPDDKKGRIFQRFGMIESSLAKNAEGTGIGLYLVKMLTDLLGGMIDFESEVGNGSKFTVLLPLTDTPISLPEPNDNRRTERTVEVELSDIC